MRRHHLHLPPQLRGRVFDLLWKAALAMSDNPPPVRDVNKHTNMLHFWCQGSPGVGEVGQEEANHDSSYDSNYEANESEYSR